jgi:DNA-binding NtrC family response regulator
MPKKIYQFTLPTTGIDLETIEREFIEQALEMTGGNQSQAARLLGISRYALRYRMQKFGFVDGKANAA